MRQPWADGPRTQQCDGLAFSQDTGTRCRWEMQAVNPARAERWPRLRPWICSWCRRHVAKRMMSDAMGRVEALRSARPSRLGTEDRQALWPE